MNIKKYTIATTTVAVAALTVGTFAMAIPAFAQTTSVSSAVNGRPSMMQNGTHLAQGEMHGLSGMGGPESMGDRGGPNGATRVRPAAFGQVTAINGNILTVAGKQGFGSTSTAVTYSVNAANATILKNNATSSLSAVAVGDTVVVQGSVSGQSITATTIHDGIPPMGRGGIGGQGKSGMMREWNDNNGSTTPNDRNDQPMITGNGQPVILGTISSINGSSVTITNKSNVTYTVDTTNAKIVQGRNTIAISGLTTGDSVIIQGTVNGTSVNATSIIVDTKILANQSAPTDGGGFMGSISRFFGKIFGF